MKLPTSMSHPCYHDEDAARAELEAIRWPNGPYCPKCGSLDRVKATTAPNKVHGGGWYHCQDCRRKFTVRVGSIFHRSHVPLHKWLLSFRLMNSSKKGFSAHQLMRTLEVDYKTAWFLEHRVRECMDDSDGSPLGGKDQVLEMDETYLGPAAEGLHAKDNWHFVNGKGWVQRVVDKKQKIVTLVERGGRARSIHVNNLNSSTILAILLQNADRESRLHTDESRIYMRPGRIMAEHESVNHRAEEWVRGDVTTNTVESYFSVFKRGMKGTYQHCSEKYLQRYLNEFDFRHSNRAALGVDDAERTTRAIQGATGRRLLYRQPRRIA
jgi:transposase-like protein